MHPTHKFSLLSLLILSVTCNGANHPSVEESFRQCLLSQQSVTLGHCFGVGAISKLRSLDSDPQFDLIDGLTLSRGQQEYRQEYNFEDRDPADIRTWIDSVSHVLSQRSLQWDMGFVYPGLTMRVAPSLTPGGHLEFILDPHQEVLNKHSLQELGTGRLIARQFLVPFLLGFKFNVATLIPILFGLLALLAKKAVFISKLALVISSAFGLGTLLLGNGNRIQHQNYHGPAVNPSFGGNGYHHNRFPDDEIYYRGLNDNKVDQFHLHNNIQKFFREEKGSEGTGRNLKGSEGTGRNFAWSEAEKIQKTS